MHIALVTARVGRHHDDDLAPLVGALTEAGHAVDVVDWDDPAADWSAYDVAVLRSTWDYTGRLDEFVAWTEHTAGCTRLHNDHRLVGWNADKRYLADLAAVGVDVVPTTYLAPGDGAVDAAVTLALQPTGEVVVKPTVSAGSRDTARYGAAMLDEAVAHARRLVGAGRTVMLQPYQRSVDEAGETALVYFAGEWSHAIGKAALLQAGAPPSSAVFAPENIAARVPGDDELAVGDRVLAVLGEVAALEGVEGPPLYARVDVVRDDEGAVRLLELELIEPSFFFAHAPGAAERFAAAIVQA